jgi:gliding motility-associated-like protein
LPSATAGSNSPVCAGNVITLTSSGGITYKWVGPDSYESNLQSPSIREAGTAMTGPYTVTVTADNGCAVTNTTNVSVIENPMANAGQVQILKFISETEMQAELSSSETGEWSVLSGTGFFEDIHSPVTRVTELSFGENIFLWKVLKDNCEDTATVKIIVYDPFIPSVITPNGDGKNDYFVIGEIIDQVEIIIFNRWGNEEYSNSNYLNDWDGRNNKGRELPNDTYFYVLKFGNIKIKKGSVLIKR